MADLDQELVLSRGCNCVSFTWQWLRPGARLLSVMSGVSCRVAVALFVSLFAAAGSANAEGWYLAVRVSIGLAQMENITHNGTIGTGMPFGTDFDGALAHEDIDDTTAGTGLGLGRRFGRWNIEVELMWRYRTDWDIAASTYSLQTITNVFTNVATSTLLLNATRHIPINANWAWEVGAGLGLVVNEQEGQYLERQVPGISPQLVIEDTTRSTDFSWNAIVGISRKLGNSWSIELRYRYIELGDLHVGPFDPRPGEVFTDHSSHEFLLSFKRRL